MKKLRYPRFLVPFVCLMLMGYGAYANPMFGKSCSSSIANGDNSNCEVQYTETTYVFWIAFTTTYSIPCSVGISSMQGCDQQ